MQALSEYGIALARLWWFWAVEVGAFVLMLAVVEIPLWAWSLIALGGLVVAQFVVFLNVRTEREALSSPQPDMTLEEFVQ